MTRTVTLHGQCHPGEPCQESLAIRPLTRVLWGAAVLPWCPVPIPRAPGSRRAVAASVLAVQQLPARLPCPAPRLPAYK